MMYYLKTFEHFDIEIEPDTRLGHQIMMEHPKGKETLEFLEKEFGNLTEFISGIPPYDKINRFFGRDKDNIVFAYQVIHTSRDEVPGVISISYKIIQFMMNELELGPIPDASKEIVMWYIESTYGVKSQLNYSDLDNYGKAEEIGKLYDLSPKV